MQGEGAGIYTVKKKALIPLPPTGFAFLFCAMASEMQTLRAPMPAAGAVGYFAIAQGAKYCEEVQRCCTASRYGGELVDQARCPAYGDYG